MAGDEIREGVALGSVEGYQVIEAGDSHLSGAGEPEVVNDDRMGEPRRSTEVAGVVGVWWGSLLAYHGFSDLFDGDL